MANQIADHITVNVIILLSLAAMRDPRDISLRAGILKKSSRTVGSILALFLVGLSLMAGRGEAGEREYQKTFANYTVPDVVLVNQDGDKVRLRKFLASEKPVVIDFIYCTCTTICPFLSSSFVNLQRKLGNDTEKVQLVSISIDPENDTPKLMKEYMKRFGGKPGWTYLTGSRKDIDSVMKAFDAYVSNKMNHNLLNLIRSPRDGKWTRIKGMMSTEEFMSECRQVGLK